MTLRLKLMLVTSGIVLTLFGVSEWLSYRQTSALLEQHEAILIETTDHSVALAKLQETREKMFSPVTTLRILHAVLTLAAAVAALNYVWYKVVYGPIRRLLSQINIMGRGTWHASIPVSGSDEITELAKAFNHLGAQLAETVRYINTSSQLSALALVGNRLVRQINISCGQITTAIDLLQRPTQGDARSTEGVAAVLKNINASLLSIEGHFEIAFDNQFQKVSAEFRNRERGSSGEEALLPNAAGPEKPLAVPSSHAARLRAE